MLGLFFGLKIVKQSYLGSAKVCFLGLTSYLSGKNSIGKLLIGQKIEIGNISVDGGGHAIGGLD